MFFLGFSVRYVNFSEIGSQLVKTVCGSACVCVYCLPSKMCDYRVVGGVTGMDCREVAAPKRGKLLEDNTVLLF